MMRNVHISGAYVILGAIIGAVATGLVDYYLIPNDNISDEKYAKEYSKLQQAYDELENKYTDLESQYNSLLESNIFIQDIKSNLEEIEGINAIESYALLTYVNQYRTKAGIPELSWDPELAKYAQTNVSSRATTGQWNQTDYSIRSILLRSKNNISDAQKAISCLMEDTDNRANTLLNASYTQMGGALYYLPDGDEYGYYYYWVISLL